MDFLCTDEQLELRATVRDFLASKSAEETVRALMATPAGYDPVVWRQLSDQLGLVGLAVPEEYEGAGFGYVELGIVLEEMGRALLCAPYLSTVALAIEALLRCTDEAARKDLLPGLAAGTTIGTLALLEQPGRWDEAGVQTRARRSGAKGSGWVLDGGKRHVLDGHIADLIMVGARTPAGIGLFAVDGAAPGLRRAYPYRRWTRPASRRTWSSPGTPARLIGDEADGWPVLRRVLHTAAILLAAEQVGGASRAVEMAAEYAGMRVQFGRPIGSFQAIKHMCADMLTEAGSGSFGGLLRPVGARGGQRGRAAGRQPGQGVLLRGAGEDRGRRHPGARRHRLHLGASRPPVLQAGQDLRGDVRHPGLPPGPARRAARTGGLRDGYRDPGGGPGVRGRGAALAG